MFFSWSLFAPIQGQLRELAGIATSEKGELVDLLASSEFADTGEKVAELSQHLLKHRAWSLSKSSAPPDCYSGLLSQDGRLQQAM